jgi:hypothetical protein
MQEQKPKTYPVPPDVAKDIAKGRHKIEGLPLPGCSFILDQAMESEPDTYRPYAAGCVVDGAGESRIAFIAIDEEHNRAKRAAYHAIGRPCLGVTVYYPQSKSPDSPTAIYG